MLKCALQESNPLPVCSLLDRNANVERRAYSYFALKVERTAVRLFHNLLGNRKPQSRAHAHRFGGEAPRKNLRTVFGLDAAAGVAISEIWTWSPSRRVRTVILPWPSIACPAFTRIFKNT